MKPILKSLPMKTANLTHPLYVSPVKTRNIEKYGETGNMCECCGKPMKEGNKKQVHMNTNWKAVSIEVSVADCKKMTGAESQGFFYIGNDCAKKMPKNFIHN